MCVNSDVLRDSGSVHTVEYEQSMLLWLLLYGLGSKTTMQTQAFRALFISFVLAVIGIRQATPDVFSTTVVSQHQPLVLPDGSLFDAQVIQSDILILVAQFQESSESQCDPQVTWEEVWNNAVLQLGAAANAHVALHTGTIETQHDARELADQSGATMVIWGRVHDETCLVDSNYTLNIHHSWLELRGIDVISDIPSQFSLLLTLESSSEYLHNFALAQLAYLSQDQLTAIPYLNYVIALSPSSESGEALMRFYRGNLVRKQSSQYTGDDRWTMLQSAITDYRAALESWSFDDDPSEYATVQVNLGITFWELSQVTDPTGNLRLAIAAYDEALRFFAPGTTPFQYALAQHHLGNAYTQLAAYEHQEDNLGQAVAAYVEALRFFTADITPFAYGMEQTNLGTAYSMFAQVNEPIANLHLAINAYSEALHYLTYSASPLVYTTAVYSRGTAYYALSDYENRAGNLSQAIAAFNEALSLYPSDSYPLDYAATQFFLGNAYAALAQIESDPDQLRLAIAAYNEALLHYTPTGSPLEYAQTQRYLGTAYQSLAQFEDPEGNSAHAVQAYMEALRFYTLANTPLEYALLMSDLGNIQFYLGQNDQACASWTHALEAYVQMGVRDQGWEAVTASTVSYCDPAESTATP